MIKNKCFTISFVLAILFFLIVNCTIGFGQSQDMIRTNSGIFYALRDTSKSNTPEIGDFVWMHLIKKNNDGIEIFNTQLFDAPEGIEMQLKAPKFNGDIEEIFAYMKSGDTAFVKIPYHLSEEAEMDSTKFFYYEIYLYKWTAQNIYLAEKENRRQAQLSKDNDSINIYLKNHGILKSKKDDSGLVIFGKFGKRKKIKSGDTVTINYIGKFLNDTVFESSWETGQAITLVAGNNDVIDGWEIALKYLGKQGKVSILIPSYLAYGERGSGNDILPNSVLIFDLEIMEIKRKQKIKSSF